MGIVAVCTLDATKSFPPMDSCLCSHREANILGYFFLNNSEFNLGKWWEEFKGSDDDNKLKILKIQISISLKIHRSESFL